MQHKERGQSPHASGKEPKRFITANDNTNYTQFKLCCRYK